MLSQKNSRKISVLSFVLFCGVMMIHTYNLETYGIEPGRGMIGVFELYTNRLANKVCVPYFFVISGFLFFRNFDLALLMDKYKNRFCSVVIPYIVWNTLYYLFFVGIAKIPFMSGFINNAGKAEFSIMAYMDYVWNGYYVFGFLRELIWMILCAPIWWLLLKRRKYYWPEPIIIALIILEMSAKNIFNINIYYVFGGYLGINCCDLINKDNRKIAFAASICFIGILVFSDVLADKYSVVYNCAFIFTSWLAMDLFSFSREIKWWMKCTFFYYCAHDVVLESIEKLILILFGRNQIMALIDYIVAPVFTLAILISAAWLMKNHTRNIWKVLNGGR